LTQKRTYAQKASVFYQVFKSNPDITLKALQDRYKGTSNSMRRDTIADLLRSFKTGATYQDSKLTTKYILKKSGQLNKSGETYLAMSTFDYDVLGDKLEIENAYDAGQKSYNAGVNIYTDHQKRYDIYQIQLLIFTEIESEDGELLFSDWLASNAFPCQFDTPYHEVFESYTRSLSKITQSLRGEVSFHSAKCKVTFWHN